jgi:hypothetical protein
MYAMAVVLALSTLMDTGIKMWPLQLGSSQWRFGAFGLLLSGPVTPLLALALAMAAGYLAESRRAVRGLSIVALAVAALLTIVLLAFLADYLAMRPTVEAPLRLTFAVATTKAVNQTLLVIPAAVGLGLGGLRSLSGSGGGTARPRHRGSLVVGQPS